MNKTDLIEALERADEPSRELDAHIADLVDGRQGSVIGYDGAPDSVVISPYYTASIDAALTLVPDGWHWEINNHCAEIAPENWPCYENANENDGQYVHHSKTAIAICMACLKAALKAEQSNG